LPDLTQNLKKLVKAYTEKQLRLWKRTPTSGKQESAAKPIRHDTCSATRDSGILNTIKGEAGFDRLAVFLPKSVKNIVVLPAIYGSLAAYSHIIASITTYLDDSASVILFSPPFYGLQPTDRNLFANFLSDKAKFKAKLYAIANSTTQSIMAGCLLDPQYMSGKSSSYVISLLEPTYVIYPYEGGFVFSGAAEDEATLPVSSSKAVVSVSRSSQKGAIAFPPNTQTEDTVAYKKYRLLGNSESILITRDTGASTVQKGGAPPVDKIQPTPDADLEMGKLFGHIELGLKSFVIRETVVELPQIYQNWLEGKYTSDEAELLNELSLRPSILEEIWPNGSWKKEVADFLDNIVVSQCFTDLTMLTDNECQTSREFVNKTMKYFLMHDDRIMRIKKREGIQDAIAAATAAAAPSDVKSNPFTGEGAKGSGAPVLQVLSPAINPQAGGDGEEVQSVAAVGDGSTLYHAKDPNSFSRRVIAININTGEYRKGLLTVEATVETAADKLDEVFKSLQGFYPDWRFII